MTDITSLANIAFADSGGNDYSAERTKRIRDAFILGMPTHSTQTGYATGNNNGQRFLCNSLKKIDIKKYLTG